jgi:ABC-2 type transport system permease protein
VSDHRLAPLAQLVLARWRGFYREPSALFWSFGFPLILSVALGVAFRARPPEAVYTAVEAGPGAAPTRAALARSPEIRATVMPPDQAREALRAGRVALVVVPSASDTPRAYRYDPTRPEARIARLLVDDLLQRADGRLDRTPVREARVTVPGSRYIDFLIPGLIGMGLLSSGLWGIGFSLAEMRTRRLLKRLVATPMRRSDFLLSFVAMRAVFVAIELPVLLGAAYVLFGVQTRGSLALLAGLALLGSVAFAGMGLLLASRADNPQTVGGLTNLVSLPMFMLSGVFFSYERFPAMLQPAIRALPLTALNDALRAVMTDGAGPAAVAGQALVVAAWGALSFAGALALFRWR